MKQVLKVLCVVFLVCGLFSCRNQNEESLAAGKITTHHVTQETEVREDNGMLEGYRVNELPLTENDQSYPLQNLRNYFDNGDTESCRTLDNINLYFPITHLRRAVGSESPPSYSYYIVYPVTEGGTFIVFLQSQIDDAVTGQQHIVASQTLYVNNLPHESDSLMIELGSTYEEVLNIAPCTVISIVFSTGPRSYSLFDNGKVLACKYSYDQNQELYVVEKTMLPLDKSVFANMVLSDLQIDS